MTFQFFLTIFLSFLISFFSTPLVVKIFRSRGWIENPKERKKEKDNVTALTSVPRGGGIPIFLAVTIVSLLFLPLDKHLLGIILASFVALIVGVSDDIKDVDPRLRFFLNFFTASLVVGAGIGIAYVSNPFGGIIDLSVIKIYFDFFGPHSIWLLADLLAIFWITACMNIVGWSAGVDGQLPGFVAISSIFIGILGLKFSADISEWPVIILAAAVAGAYLGFLPFNFFPQKIMPGYSGKSLAGFFLAVLAILSGAKLATVVLLLGVPVIDAIFVFTKRILQGRVPLYGGPDHLHHQLLKLGWSRRKIAITYWFFSLILGLLSLTLNSQQKFYTFIGLFLLFFSVVITISRRT